MEDYLLHFLKNHGIEKEVNKDLFRKWTHCTEIEDVKFIIKRVDKQMTVVGLSILNSQDQELFTKMTDKKESHITALTKSPALVHTFNESQTKAIIDYWTDQYNHYHGFGAVLH